MTPDDNAEHPLLYGASVRVLPDDRNAAALFEEIRSAGIGKVRIPVSRQQWKQPGAPEWYCRLLDALPDMEAVVALYAAETEGDTGNRVTVPEPDAYRHFITDVHARLGDRLHWLELTGSEDLFTDGRSAIARLLDELGSAGIRICIGGLRSRRPRFGDGVHAFAFRASPETADPLQSITTIRERQELDHWLVLDGEHPPGGPTGHPLHDMDLYNAMVDARISRCYVGLPPEAAAARAALRSIDGKPLLIPRLLQQGGPATVRSFAACTGPRQSRPRGYELVIGGAGFIGCNVAARLAGEGRDVLVYDDLSRPGTERNVEWLRRRFPGRVAVQMADIRDADAIDAAVRHARRIFHLAAQVAVTTSLEHPRLDHDINITGTLNILEAVRRGTARPPLIFTSTNKVYGALADIELRAGVNGYEPVDEVLRAHGIAETRPLEFYSPYGCSKGAADQYVLDYAHTFGLPATVVRMSCIYGPRQFGNEDQGWVAHFMRQALTGQPVTLYGDGLQVRDVLYIDDLVNALLSAAGHLPAVAGQAYNLGGGPTNVISLRGLLDRMAAQNIAPPELILRDARPGDQRYYVSDTRRFQSVTGWQPLTGINQGLRHLRNWLAHHVETRHASAPQQEQIAL